MPMNLSQEHARTVRFSDTTPTNSSKVPFLLGSVCVPRLHTSMFVESFGMSVYSSNRQFRRHMQKVSSVKTLVVPVMTLMSTLTVVLVPTSAAKNLL